MPGPPVTLGCAVTLTPGPAGVPDAGAIISIPQTLVTSTGMPLAVAGSTCQLVNSITGVPYTLPIPPLGCSTGVKVLGMALVRMGDRIPAGPGILIIAGPPVMPTLTDTFPP